MSVTLCVNDFYIESMTPPPSHRPSVDQRALPQLPGIASNLRPRPSLPTFTVAEMEESGHYTDIHGVTTVRSDASRRTPTSRENDGHHTAVRDSEDHYIDIDRLNARPGSADQSVLARSYEGLDPSVLSALRQAQRRHEYAGLASAERAVTGSTNQRRGHIEMTDVHAGNDSRTAVSQLVFIYHPRARLRPSYTVPRTTVTIINQA